jgi:hypothetical protein
MPKGTLVLVIESRGEWEADKFQHVDAQVCASNMQLPTHQPDERFREVRAEGAGTFTRYSSGRTRRPLGPDGPKDKEE